jgi:hypothetical protein
VAVGSPGVRPPAEPHIQAKIEGLEPCLVQILDNQLLQFQKPLVPDPAK